MEWNRLKRKVVMNNMPFDCFLGMGLEGTKISIAGIPFCNDKGEQSQVNHSEFCLN
jgi:hypothetical protein